jgi:hypothetical protein
MRRPNCGSAVWFAEHALVPAVPRHPMKKRIITAAAAPDSADPGWLELGAVAEVEITSESATHPIERALLRDESGGWRASAPGEQIIRLNFVEPRRIKRVHLVIEELERERTQQFVLRATAADGGPWRELVRQQFNFSPGGATREQEDYRIDLSAVAALELTIVPDISGGDAVASLQQLRVA